MRRTGRYAKIIDGILNHRKFFGLDPTAGWLWTLGLAYCHDQLTDGAIPSAVPARLLGMAPARAAKIAGLLVTAKLWDVTDDGWRVHDYLDWNDSKEEILADQAADAARKRRERPRGVRPDVRPDSARNPPGLTPESNRSPGTELSYTELDRTTTLEDPSKVSHETRSNGTTPGGHETAPGDPGTLPGDEILARALKITPAEVARRRAAARLA